MRWLKVSVPLVKENLRSNWAIAAFGLFAYFFAAVFPVFTLDGFSEVSRWLKSLLEFSNLAMILFNTLIPLLSAITVLRYLQEPGTVTAMHSLPLTRPMLLASHFLSGLAICWLPLIITCAASVLSMTAKFAGQSDAISSGYIISQFALMLLQTALIFSTFIIAGIAASNTPMHLVTCVAFAGLPSVLGLLADALCSKFLFGYQNFITIPAVPFYFTIKMGNPGILVVIGYFAATLALFAGAIALYNKRPLEKAGDSVAFGFMEVGFCTCSSLIGGYIFAYPFELIYGGKEAYFFAGMAIGGFASFFVARMIVKKTLRVWNIASFKQFGIFAAITALLLASLKTDAYGFERRVPKARNVKSVSISLDSIIGESEVYISKSEHVFKSKDAVDAVISIHDRVINSDEEKEYDYFSNYLTINYDLASGGRFSRRWHVFRDLFKNDASLAALLDTDEFKAQNKLDDDMKIESFVFQGNYSNAEYVVPQSEFASLVAALNVDLSEQTAAQMMEDRTPEFGAKISLNNRYIYVEVPSDFQSTIRLINEKCIRTEIETE